MLTSTVILRVVSGSSAATRKGPSRARRFGAAFTLMVQFFGACGGQWDDFICTPSTSARVTARAARAAYCLPTRCLSASFCSLRMCFHGGAWACPMDTLSTARKSRPRAPLLLRPQRCHADLVLCDVRVRSTPLPLPWPPQSSPQPPQPQPCLRPHLGAVPSCAGAVPSCAPPVQSPRPSPLAGCRCSCEPAAAAAPIIIAASICAQ